MRKSVDCYSHFLLVTQTTFSFCSLISNEETVVSFKEGAAVSQRKIVRRKIDFDTDVIWLKSAIFKWQKIDGCFQMYNFSQIMKINTLLTH